MGRRSNGATRPDLKQLSDQRLSANAQGTLDQGA